MSGHQRGSRGISIHRRPCIILVWACLLHPLLSGPARAQEGSGGTQSVFCIGAGSRGISLGRSFVSLADDASAIYWNPAALRNVQNKEFMGMYMPLYGEFTGATYTFLGAAYPTLGAGAFGFGFMRVATTFEGYDASSRPTGEGEYSETQVMFGYAFERRWRFIRGALASGVSFKIANQKITPYSSTSPGLDIGFRYSPDFARAFVLAMNLQDVLGPTHRLVSENDKTYRTVMTGLGYTRTFRNGSALRLMLQLDLPERADTKFHAGAEYAFSRYVSLRVGYDDRSVTFGLGVNVAAFGLDYAFLSRETAGSSHPVSFIARYGQSLYEQTQAVEEQRAVEEKKVVEKAFRERVRSHRELAEQFESQDDIPRALDEWKIVLEYLPGDQEAEARMAALTLRMVEEQERSTRDIENRAIISSNFSQGLQLYNEKDYAGAKAKWRAVLQMDSLHAGALEYQGKTEQKVGELVLEHKERARALEAEGRYTEAIGEWKIVETLAPADTAGVAILRIYGKIELQSKDHELTAARLRVVDLYNDAMKYYARGAYEEAMTKLRTLLELEPDHEEAKTLLTMARRKLTPLSKEEESEIRRLYLKGMEYYSRDDYTSAIAEWEKILEIDPVNESVKRSIEEAKERLRMLSDRSK